MIKKNVGWVERTVRILLGTQASAGYFMTREQSDLWSYVLLSLGVTLLLTAVWGWCPLRQFCRKSS